MPCFRRFVIAAAAASACLGSAAFGMVINLNPNATLSANAPALAAFQRAADHWSSRLTDPITVNIDAGLSSLDFGIIGSTGSVMLSGDYDEVRNQMVADAADEGADDAVVAFLPTAATFSAFVPAGVTRTGGITLSKANTKALGFTGLDEQFGATDAVIDFSTNFSFDFDNSDGVTPGTVDFETVATHEIGHALGFFSAVDEVNAGATEVDPYPLDLFRFRDNVLGSDPATLADFAVAIRDLTPGQNDIIDDLAHEYAASTGVASVTFPGVDGNQASHWKADELTGLYIGIMDPTLASGVSEQITFADLRAMDLIGYEFNSVPEPTSLAAIGVGGLMMRRRRA